MNKDARITGILAEFGEDLSSTWVVQGQRVIYHAALERIAAKAKITWDEPTFVLSSDAHAVVKASGHLPYGKDDTGSARWEWSVGEAHIGVNYRVSGKQAAYPYAMAEKRAKDRVILKLINLHGLLYSEEEADDFKESAPPQNNRREIMSDAISSGKPVVLDDGVVHPGEALKRKVREQGTALGIKNLMLEHEVQVYLSSIPEDQKDELREFALARMADLGWGKRNG